MPTYVYKCPVCSRDTEIVKSIRLVDQDENCAHCNVLMQMVIHPTYSNRSNCQFEPHFNYAFGKKIASKRELTEAKAMHEGETGKKLIEVGTEGMHHVKMPKKSLTLNDSEMRQATQMLKEIKGGRELGKAEA